MTTTCDTGGGLLRAVLADPASDADRPAKLARNPCHRHRRPPPALTAGGRHLPGPSISEKYLAPH